MKKILSISLLMLCSISTFAAGHVVSIVATTNVSCYGGSDGSITASVSGGVGPFTYLWSPTGATTSTITGIAAGTYTVTVTDNSDMSTSTATAVVTQPPAVTVSLAASSTVCSGACVALSPSVMGGVGAFTFTWTPASGLSSSTLASPISCPGATTTYTVLVTDANGCVGTATTTVYVSTPVSGTVTHSDPSGCGLCDGSATVTGTGGSPVYTYVWNPGGFYTTTLPGLCTGTYTVTVTDINGCSGTNTVTLSDPLVHASFTMVPDSTNANTFWAFNTSTGNISYYFWDLGDGTTSPLESPVVTYGSTGVIPVCLMVGNGGCGDTLCQSVNVTGVVDPCMALFHIADDTTSSDPNAYTVYNLSYGSPLTYLWDFGDSTTSTLANPTHVYSTSTGPYQICLTVDNGSGCSHTYCDSIFSVDSLSRSLNPISFTVVDVPAPLITGVQETAASTVVSVYPNPFTDVTTFSLKGIKQTTYTFELSDVLGKMVKKEENITGDKFEISRSGLENGVYFYKIYGPESPIAIGKLIVK